MQYFILPFIVILTLFYVYYWAVVVFAKANHHIDRTDVNNNEIVKYLIKHKHTNHPFLFRIQITTRGGYVNVVKRGIKYVIKAAVKYPILQKIVMVEIITEDIKDKILIDKEFADNGTVPVTVYILPANYETTNGTHLKARALHYMVEQHRINPLDSYIVHYDEESVFTEDNLARLVRNLLRDPIGISEGSISYPLEWSDSHIMCRTMESNRPFGCHECYVMMNNPAPLSLHGSNLVVQEKLENKIGWDIGSLNGSPLIAEDMVFGLMCFLKFGKKAFGWHGVEMIEQPPFTLKAAYKQRERWVLGALQGVAHVKSLPNYNRLSLLDKFKIQVLIRLRVATYAIGAPISVISLVILTFYCGYDITTFIFGGQPITTVTWVSLPGLFLWLGANQVGLWQNLRYTEMTNVQKTVEHFKILAITPFSGLFDTAGPFVAVIKWSFGVRGINWIPTPKTAGQEYGIIIAEGEL
jgi:egghead protein (zeste-white 4 protein)